MGNPLVSTQLQCIINDLNSIPLLSALMRTGKKFVYVDLIPETLWFKYELAWKAFNDGLVNKRLRDFKWYVVGAEIAPVPLLNAESSYEELKRSFRANMDYGRIGVGRVEYLPPLGNDTITCHISQRLESRMLNFEDEITEEDNAFFGLRVQGFDTD